MATPQLFPCRLSRIDLANRIVTAPMTRNRATSCSTHHLMTRCRGQRAAAGPFVTEGASPSPTLRSRWQNLVGRQKLYIGNVRSEPRDYAEIEAVLASGAVRSMIDRVVPLAQASEAFAASETGGRAGKGVIAVGERRRSRLAPRAACLVGAGRASAPPPTRPGLRSGRRCGPVMRLGRRHPREIQQPLGDSPPMA